MKINYIANVRLPTERAHGTQIMKMCEAFADEGARVNLIIPNKKKAFDEDIFSYYNVKKNIEIVFVNSFDFLGKTLKFGRILYWLDAIFFILGILGNKNISKGDIVYSRDPFLLTFFSIKKYILCAEIHDIPRKSKLFIFSLKRMNKIIVLNEIMKQVLIEHGVDSSKVIVSGDAVDLKEFDIGISKKEARKALSLPEDKKVIMYTGHLYEWKGAQVLAEAAKLMGAEYLCVFVGGVDKELEEFIKKFSNVKNILITGFKKRQEIPLCLCAADVLVIPNSAKTQISREFTSPLKLFEYMASNRPIVTSDLPSIREVLNENIAFFAKSDNPESFAKTIQSVFGSISLADQKALLALSETSKYTWKKRAEKIINFLKN